MFCGCVGEKKEEMFRGQGKVRRVGGISKSRLAKLRFDYQVRQPYLQKSIARVASSSQQSHLSDAFDKQAIQRDVRKSFMTSNAAHTKHFSEAKKFIYTQTDSSATKKLGTGGFSLSPRIAANTLKKLR